MTHPLIYLVMTLLLAMSSHVVADESSKAPTLEEFVSVAPSEGQTLTDQGFLLRMSNTDSPVEFLWETRAAEGIGSSTFTQPKVADLDRDGRMEIISVLRSADGTGNCGTNIDQAVYVWDETGQIRPGFPVSLGLTSSYTCGYVSIPAVGDVVGDTRLEIVVGTGRATYSGGVYIVSDTGVILSRLLPYIGFSGQDLHHVVLNDLDNDGKLEILANGDEANRAKMYVWRGDGALVAGWPIDPPNDRAGEPLVIRLSGIQTSETCTIHVDTTATEPVDTGKLIVFTVMPFYLPGTFPPEVVAYRTDGTLAWRTTVSPRTITLPHSKLFAGDVEGDGTIEIILMALDQNVNPIAYDMMIFDESGRVKYQWTTDRGWSYTHGVSLGDLDNNGTLEIIYHDDTSIFVRDYQGNPMAGFPRVIWDGDPAAMVYSRLTDLGVADLNGDGYADVYGVALYNFWDGSEGSFQYSVVAFDRSGNSLENFPYHLLNYDPVPSSARTFTEQYMPTVADIDGNLRLDMVTSKGWGRMEALTLGVTSSRTLAYFPQYGVDRANSKVVPGRGRNVPPILYRCVIEP